MAANIQKDENNLCQQQRRSIVLKSFFFYFTDLNIGNKEFCLTPGQKHSALFEGIAATVKLRETVKKTARVRKWLDQRRFLLWVRDGRAVSQVLPVQPTPAHSPSPVPLAQPHVCSAHLYSPQEFVTDSVSRFDVSFTHFHVECSQLQRKGKYVDSKDVEIQGFLVEGLIRVKFLKSNFLTDIEFQIK